MKSTSLLDVVIPDKYFLLIGIVTFITLIIYRRNITSNNRPPCYGGWIPWLGCAIEFGKCPLYFIEECRKKLGPVFTLKVAGTRLTFITEPEDYRYFFSSAKVDFQQAVQGPVEKTASIPEESFQENHTRMHDTVKWTLAQANLGPVCQKLYSKFNEGLQEWDTTGEGDLHGLIRRTMYKAVLDNLFGDNVLPTSPQDAFKLLERHFIKFDEDFEYATRLPSVFLRDWRTSKWWLLDLFKVIIRKMQNTEKASDNETLFKKVVQAVKGPHAANFAMLLMWASLANAIPITFWTVAFILCNADVHDKVKQELKEAFLKNKGKIDVKELTEADLTSLPYIKMCVLEAIRLRSPGVITRGVKEPLHVKGYTIPVGDMLMLSPYWTHHNPKYFPEPENFKPDRWLSYDLEKTTFVDGFVAFGHGRYQCPGRWFALMEIHLFVALLFSRYQLTAVDPLPKHSPLHLVGSQQPETAMRVKYSRII